MRLVSYRDPDGATFGAVEGDAIFELGRRHGIASLRAALAGGGVPAAATRPDCRLTDIELLPPIPDAAKIVCVGLNYRAHAAEASRELPAYPSLFLRANATVVGHLCPMIRPSVRPLRLRGRARRDHRPEGALCPGGTRPRHRRGVHLLQRRLAPPLPETFGDGRQELSVERRLRPVDGDGQCSAGSGRSRPHHPAERTGDAARPDQRADPSGWRDHRLCLASDRTPPGDVIATGTPEGVGLARTPPVWMQPGDRIEVEIAGIGTLANPIEAEHP